jgi:class 3 adenylate cyclase
METPMGRSGGPPPILAIVFGASEWRFHKALQTADASTFANSAIGFTKYLSNEDGLNLPRENILDLFDKDEPQDQIDFEIASFLKDRQKALADQGSPATDLIVYYVGHGGFTSGDQAYFFAIRRTRENAEGSSSLRVSDLATTLKREGKSLRRYLIFDCCFAAEAFKMFQGPITQGIRRKTLEYLPPNGTAIFCAASSRDFASARPGEPYTMFSGALLHVLQHGDPQTNSPLSLVQVGELVHDRINEQFPEIGVRPEVLSPDQRQGDISIIPLFPNGARRIVGPDKEERLTLMFADMRGFTRLSLINDAEGVQTLVNEFLALLAREIREFDGVVNKFMGATVFAFFREPSAEERAVRCALSMIDNFILLHEKWNNSHNLDLDFVDIGIGISSGKAFLGSVGGDKVREFTAMGLAVNFAAALQKDARGVCKKCNSLSAEKSDQHRKRVLVDRNTFNAVRDIIEPPCEYLFEWRKSDEEFGHVYKCYHVRALRAENSG